MILIFRIIKYLFLISMVMAPVEPGLAISFKSLKSICRRVLVPPKVPVELNALRTEVKKTVFGSDFINDQNGVLSFQGQAYKELQSYLVGLNFKSLTTEEDFKEVSDRILELIYGNKYSFWYHIRNGHQKYTDRKQTLILKEQVLRYGLQQLKSEQGDLPLSWYQKFRDLIQKLSKGSGLKWVLQRIKFDPINYRALSQAEIENLLESGIDLNRKDNKDFFSSQKKRDIFNDYQIPVSVVVGFITSAIVSYSAYISTVNENIDQIGYQATATSREIEFQRQIFKDQHHLLEHRLAREEGLLDSLTPEE